MSTVTRSCNGDLLAVCGLGELLDRTVVRGGRREERKKVRGMRERFKKAVSLFVVCGCRLKLERLKPPSDRQPTGTHAAYLS